MKILHPRRLCSCFSGGGGPGERWGAGVGVLLRGGTGEDWILRVSGQSRRGRPGGLVKPQRPGRYRDSSPGIQARFRPVSAADGRVGREPAPEHRLAASQAIKDQDLGTLANRCDWVKEKTPNLGHRLEGAAGRPKKQATDRPLTSCHHGQRAHGQEGQRDGKRWVPSPVA